MSRFSEVSDKPVEQVPKGLYFGMLKSIDDWEQQAGGKYKSNGPQLKWVFVLKGIIHANKVRPTDDQPDPKQPEEFIGEEIWAFTGTTMTPNAKARAWAEALLDTTFVDGQKPPEDDELVGQWAAITVGRTETGRHKVESLEPYEPPKQRARRAPAADEEPERELATAGVSKRRAAAPADDEDDLDF